MIDIKAKTIFSRIIPILPKDAPEATKNRKVSYWIEKLHIQGETIQQDINKKKEALKKSLFSRSKNEKVPNQSDQKLTQLGIDAHLKTVATKKEADKEKVNDLVRKSNRRIISISSMFPWDVFPNTIEVEESRITFKFSQFLSSQSHSVDIKDISNIFIESSMFFATLQVVSRTYVQNDIKIGHLNKTKAVKVQKIVEGLRTFAENDINTSNYEINELISKIEEFHTTS